VKTLDQLDLFGDVIEMPPHRKRSPTSVAAARQVAAKFSSRQMQALEWIGYRGERGATQTEVSEHFGWPRQSVCSIMWTLERNRKIVKTALVRLGKLGAKNAIYRVRA
jgi:hypothetical protein